MSDAPRSRCDSHASAPDPECQECRMARLRALVIVLERENRRLEREVLALRQLRAAEVDA